MKTSKEINVTITSMTAFSGSRSQPILTVVDPTSNHVKLYVSLCIVTPPEESFVIEKQMSEAMKLRAIDPQAKYAAPLRDVAGKKLKINADKTGNPGISQMYDIQSLIP